MELKTLRLGLLQCDGVTLLLSGFSKTIVSSSTRV